MEGNSINLFINFSSKIADILDKHVPITKPSPQETESNNKPWLTKEISKSVKKNTI